MPLLDVSDIITDPDFVDTVTVTRTTVVTVNGRGQRSSRAFPARGVVTSSQGDTLDRQAEGRLRHGSITFHTRTRLYPGQGDTDADEITYRGQRYTVTSVNDYSAYGAGFVAAECELKPLT